MNWWLWAVLLVLGVLLVWKGCTWVERLPGIILVVGEIVVLLQVLRVF
jgi:hypothetical protein